MDLGIIAAIVMWGIVALFSILHLIKGFRRGAKKSLYFSLTNILAMFIALLIFSFISISWFLTPEGLISMLQSFNINTQSFEPLLEDEAIVSLVFSLIDVSWKLVAFFILYPLIRWLISLVIFKPMWRIVKVIGKRNILYYDYDTGEYVEEVRNITSTSRFFGGLFGFFRGFVAGILIILPIVIIIGMTDPLINAITNFENNNNSNNTSTLSSSPLANGSIDGMIDEFKPYLEYVSTINKYGPYNVLSNVKLGNKSIGDSMFDLAFNVEIIVDDVKVRVSLTNELTGIFDIAADVYNSGYLNSDFNFENISEADLPLIEKAFTYLSDSNLFTNLIPVGTNLFVNNYSEDLIEINFNNRPYAMEAINEFIKVDWSGESGEFMKLFEVIKETLTFGSVGQWLELINEEKYYDLTPSQAQQLGKIVRNVGKLDILMFANVFVDYATTLDEVTNLFTYVDELEREEYLQNKLSFILDDTKYFTKGHFDVIANVIELIFANPSIDKKELINNLSDPNILLSQDHANYLTNIIGEVANLEILLDVIPLGVDFGLYEVLKLDIDNPEVIVIDGVLQDFKWNDEINNITDLYRSVAQLGIQGFFGNNPNMPLLIDLLVTNHINSIKNITNKVLTSEGMEGILQVALPSLVKLYYNPIDEMGEEIKDFLLDELLVVDNNGVVEFKVAEEVANILTILDGLYQTTDYTYINNLVTRFTSGETISYGEVVNILVGLDSFSRNAYNSDLTYEQFIQAINNLQIFDYGNDFVLKLAGEMFSDDIYISEDNISGFIIKDEIVEIIHLLKAYGGYHQGQGGSFNQVSLSQFIDEELKEYVENLPLLVKTNIAFYLDKIITENTEFNVPINANYEDSEWLDEVDTLLLSIFDVHRGAFIEDSNNELVLNFNFINNILDNYEDLPLEVITKFGDRNIAINSFSRLANSKILSFNIKEFVNGLSIDEVDIVWPESLDNGDLIDGETLALLISDTLAFVSDYNEQSLKIQTLGEAININFNNLNTANLVNAYYKVNYNTVTRFAGNEVLNEIFTGILNSSKLQDTLYSTLNSSIPFTVEEGIFEDLTLVGNEFYELLQLFYSLRLPAYIINTPQSEIVNATLSYLTNDVTKYDLTRILEYSVFHQVLTRVLNNSEVRNYVLTTGSDLLNSSLPTEFNNLTLDLDSYYNVLIGFEKEYNYGEVSLSLFDVSKVTELLDIYQLLDINSENDLNNLNLSIINRFIINDELNTVTKSELVRTLIGTVLTDQGILDFITEYSNNLLNTYGIDYQIANDQLIVGHPIVSKENDRVMLEQEVFIATLKILGAVDVQDLISNPINVYEFITKLNDVAFPSIDNSTRLDILYDNVFVDEFTKYIIQNEDISISISNTINNRLEQILPTINSNLVLNTPVTANDVLVTEEMVSKDNFVTLVNTVKKLDENTVNNVTRINTIKGAYQGLKLNEDSTILIEFLQSPLIKTVIGRVFDHGLYSDLVSQISNVYLESFNVDAKLTSDVFHLHYENKDELIIDLVELFVSVYATGYEIGQPVNLNLVKQLETHTVTYNGLTEFRIDRLFASNLLVNYLDQILRNEEVLEALAEFSTIQINTFASSMGFNLDYTVTKDLLEVPDVAIKDGIINPEEYKLLIMSFNDLELNSMSELSNFTNIEFIHEKLVNTSAVETIFKSNWLHTGITRLTKDSNLHNGLAVLVENQANSRLGISANVDGRVFDFTDAKYGLYLTTGSREGNIDVNVVKQLLVDATRHNWLNDFSNNINDLVQMLLKEGSDGRAHIDVISENKLVTAIYDRILNPNHNEYNLSELYTEVINDLVNRMNLSELAIGDSSLLFDYDESMLNSNNVLDSTDIARIVRGLSVLDLTNPTNVRIITIANTIDNDRNNNGIDDFEELMGANLFNHLLTTALREDRLYEQATQIISSTLGVNINIPVSSIIFPEELITNNKVSIDELKKLVTAISIIEQSSSEFANLAPEVLLKLVDQNIDNGKDDLDRVLDSDYLLFVIGNILNHNGLNRLANRVINRLLDADDTDISVTAPTYLLSTEPGITNGRIKRDELRNIIVSMKLMFGEESIDPNNVNLSLVLDLIGRDDNNNGIDDFDEVNQGYIHYILGTALTNSSVVNLIAQGLEVDINDVIFSNVMYDENGVMSKFEVKQLMLGLDVLGISDFEDMESGMNPNMLNELDDSQIDVLLASSYLYRVIDLTIKGQVDLPTAAFNDTGNYIGYVAKTEINKLVEAIDIIGGDLNIDVNNVTVADLENLIALESNIIDFFVTREIDTRYPNLNSSAYRDLDQSIYTTLELSHLVKTLEILIGFNGYLTELDSINIDNLTDNDLDEIIKLKSIIVTRIISVEITTNVITNTPDDSFVDAETKLDLKQGELENLVEAVTILGGSVGNLNSLDEHDITDTRLNALIDLDSPLINVQISDTIKDLIDVSQEALDHNGVILESEMRGLSSALALLGGNVAGIKNLDANNIYGETLKDLLDINSVIVDHQISSVIIEVLADDIPDDAYDINNLELIDKAEMYKLASSLIALGVSAGEVDTIDTNVINSATLSEIHGYESKIIDRQISNSMNETLVDLPIPVGAKDSDGHIKRDEVGKLIDSIDIIGKPIDEVKDIDANILEKDKLDQLHGLNSLILDRIMSNSIKEGLDNNVAAGALDAEGHITRDEIGKLIQTIEILGGTGGTINTIINIDANTLGEEELEDLLDLDSFIIDEIISDSIKASLAPDVYSDSLDGDGNIEKEEMYNIVEALGHLGGTVANITGLDANSLSTEKLNKLHEIESTIIDRLISNSIRGVLDYDIYSPTLDSKGYIDRIEVGKLIDAIDIIGADDFTKINSLSANTVTPGTLDQLVGLNSVIIDRQLSKTIDLALDVPDYVKDVDGFITRDELVKLSSMLTALNLGYLNEISSLDKDSINSNNMNIMINSGSGIAHHAMSNAIINAGLANPDSLIVGTSMNGEVKAAELQGVSNFIGLSAGTSIGDLTNLNGPGFIAFFTTVDSADIEEIFNNTDHTIMYYRVRTNLKEFDESLPFSQYDDTDFIDSDRSNELTRQAVINTLT